MKDAIHQRISYTAPNGKQYNIVVNIGGPSGGGEFSNVGGHYEDVYVKTPQGWKFKRREFIQIKVPAGRGRGANQTPAPAPAPAR